MRVWELIFVVFRPPYLSISRFRTKLKSPSTILWSFGRASIVCTNSMKNSGSSSFGAYKLTNVHLISSNSVSRTTYLPSLSVIHLWIVLCTFCLNKITTHFDAPVPSKKYISPFHSFFQSLSVCVVLCVPCKRTMLEFLFSNQCSTCLRLYYLQGLWRLEILYEFRYSWPLRLLLLSRIHLYWNFVNRGGAG